MTTFSGLFGGGGGTGIYTAPHMGYASGKYYNVTALKAGTATTASALTGNQVYYTPVYLHSDVSLDAIVFENTGTSDSGRKVRVGIYSNQGGAPGALVVAAGEITIGASGAMNQGSIATTPLARGWYWFATLTDGSVTARVSTAANGLEATWGLQGAASASTGLALVNYASLTYGALPSTATAPTSSNLVPVLVARVA